MIVLRTEFVRCIHALRRERMRLSNRERARLSVYKTRAGENNMQTVTCSRALIQKLQLPDTVFSQIGRGVLVAGNSSRAAGNIENKLRIPNRLSEHCLGVGIH